MSVETSAPLSAPPSGCERSPPAGKASTWSSESVLTAARCVGGAAFWTECVWCVYSNASNEQGGGCPCAVLSAHHGEDGPPAVLRTRGSYSEDQPQEEQDAHVHQPGPQAPPPWASFLFQTPESGPPPFTRAPSVFPAEAGAIPPPTEPSLVRGGRPGLSELRPPAVLLVVGGGPPVVRRPCVFPALPGAIRPLSKSNQALCTGEWAGGGSLEQRVGQLAYYNACYYQVITGNKKLLLCHLVLTPVWADLWGQSGGLAGNNQGRVWVEPPPPPPHCHLLHKPPRVLVSMICRLRRRSVSKAVDY